MLCEPVLRKRCYSNSLQGSLEYLIVNSQLQHTEVNEATLQISCLLQHIAIMHIKNNFNPHKYFKYGCRFNVLI